MHDKEVYDLAIAGGGLAGLSLSIRMARKGYRVLLLEKESYPFHRVCGEYISLESWDYVQSLGLDLDALHVSHISRLQVSGVDGRSFTLKLPLGGFGISRYRLDHLLAEEARQAGVLLMQDCKVFDIIYQGDGFELVTAAGSFHSKVAVAAFGKRSNLDIKWKRPFVVSKRNKYNNYVGVKYHIQATLPDDLISMHIFPKGYCGIVKVEDDNYCLCYLTTAENVIAHKGDLERMEAVILSQNPFLKRVLETSPKKFKDPVTIAQVSFDAKEQVYDHVLLTGDSAGMIAPLCGNGMSMAFHSSRIAEKLITRFLATEITREEMEQLYIENWRGQFSSRLSAGRIIQRMSLSSGWMKLFVLTGRLFPGLMRAIIRRTHGKNISAG